ncbi:MAG: hypothetical protein P8X57_06410 [Cyclobacteriaceae bacterium]
MKKALIITGIVIGSILLTMIIIPVFFKDTVKKGIDEAIAGSVNADIVWEADDY